MLQLVQDVYNSGTSCTENSLPDKHSHMLNILLLKASFPSCSHIRTHTLTLTQAQTVSYCV